MSQSHSIIWDGRFIQEVPNAFAQAEQAAGRAQIFEGPRGYQPFFTMLPLSAFPFNTSSVFNPDNLFGANDGGGVIACGDLGLCMFQDAAGTVPVTAVGQSVLSVRARNRPTFLMVHRTGSRPVTYQPDPQGFPALKAGSGNGWAFFEKKDGGVPVTDFSVVLTSMGQYGPDQIGIGTGWTVLSDVGGAEYPYSYSGIYTTYDGDAAELSVNLDSQPLGTKHPISENIDGRPYVFSSRVSGGNNRFQINLEPTYVNLAPESLMEVPVGINFWVGADDYWYGGVFISRDLNDEENAETQVWCGNLAGITLSPLPPAFHPLDLFNPGDRGVFANPMDINILFQARTGPTNPVTAPGQGVGWIVNEYDSAFSMQRTVAASNYTYQAPGELVGVASDTLTTQFSSPVFADVTECTFAQAGFCQLPEMRTGANHSICSFGPHGLSLTDGVQIFVQIGVTTNRMASQTVTGSVGAINNIPDEEFDGAYVTGGIYDFSAGTPNQYGFFNDLEVNLEVNVLPPTSGFRVGTSIWANAAGVPYWNSAFFFIDRKLSPSELIQLKTWMLENTPTP